MIELREMDELISIVVPVYNVERYLKDCLDSIARQTYAKLDILLIDDGSTDKSGSICDMYAQKDRRFRVIHKKNGGLSDARNTGISLAEGSLLTFIDSDDVVSKDYVKYLYYLTVGQNADIGVCELLHWHTGEKALFQSESKIKLYSSEEALCEMLYQNSFLVAACGKLYRKELFNSIRFPSGMIFEDSAVIYKIFDTAEKVVYGDARLYGYRHREGSITSKKFEKNDCDILPICEQIVEYFAPRGKRLRKAAASYRTVGALRVYMNAPRNEGFEKEIEESRNIIRKCGASVMFDSNARAKTRIAVLMFFVARPLMPFVYNKIDRWK